MNERYTCYRCFAREAYSPSTLCLSCEIIAQMKLRAQSEEADLIAVLAATTLAGSTMSSPVLVETVVKPTNIRARKIRF